MHLRDGFLADQLDPIYVAYNMWIIGFIKTFLSLTTFDINIEVILEERVIWQDMVNRAQCWTGPCDWQAVFVAAFIKYLNVEPQVRYDYNYQFIIHLLRS